MIGIRAAACAALVAGVAAMPAAAQGVSFALKGSRPQSLIDSFGSADVYGQGLGQTVLRFDTETFGLCETGLTLSTERFFRINPAADALIAERAGADGEVFHEVVRTEGCGETRFNNVYIFVHADGSNELLPSFPGQSAASLQVQAQAYQQTSPIAAAAIVELFGSCAADGVVPPAIVRDMEIQTEPEPTFEAWQEVWTFYQCERVIPIILDFSRGDSGLALDAYVPRDFSGTLGVQGDEG